MWKIQKIVSKGDYNYSVVPEHPCSTKTGYVLSHRIVMENHLGRLLGPDEVVHHKNNNKKDNRVSNLEVMSISEHARYHGLLQGRTTVEFCCPQCATRFCRRKRDSLDKSRHPGKLFFCSKRCSSYYQSDKTRQVDVTVSENVLRIFKDNSEVTA